METYRSGHNGADSKSVRRQRHVGSNPTVSAKYKASKQVCLLAFFYIKFEIVLFIYLFLNTRVRGDCRKYRQLVRGLLFELKNMLQGDHRDSMS